MKIPDLAELANLEAIAGFRWHEVHHPTGAGDSINPVTNLEQLFIQAVRADQAVAQWYLDNAEAIKHLVRVGERVEILKALHHEPHQ